MTKPQGGMRETVAAESTITSIDGQAGELRYRGYSVGDLAERCSFEQVAYLLWYGELPIDDQLDALVADLSRCRSRDDLISQTRGLPASAHPLDVLRYLVSADALVNPVTWDNSAESNYTKATEFTAWFPVAVAALHRQRDGFPVVHPQRGLSTAANFLFMLRGTEARRVEVDTLDTSLVLHADHEMNASTFAARVTIATQSNLHAAIISALGALSGPRHGGASERVIQMLNEIGTADRTESYVQSQLGAGERIMGFGHAVYRTVDPRSRYLRAMAERMLAGTEHEPWIAILDRLRDIVEREKGLYPNVDLYSAVVDHELGIDPSFYTSIFAMSRVVGWTAHAIEQLDGRLIRPASSYVGPGPRALPER